MGTRSRVKCVKTSSMTSRNHLATAYQRIGVHSQAELIGAVRGYPE
jgi:DNA-binding CsgD family transcriptional regulator